MYMPLVGQISRPTAQRLCLPRRENLPCRESTGLNIDVSVQVSQPYPWGSTCSPLGPPRRHSLFQIFFFDDVLTAGTRKGTIGTLANHMPPAVGVSLVSSPSYRLTPVQHL